MQNPRSPRNAARLHPPALPIPAVAPPRQRRRGHVRLPWRVGRVCFMQNRIVPVLILIGLLANSSQAEDRPAATRAAAATTQSKQSGKPQTQPVAEKLSVTEHEMKVGAETMRYKATAGTMPLKDEAGEARGDFFFLADERHTDGPGGERAITFVFNGGAGGGGGVGAFGKGGG